MHWKRLSFLVILILHIFGIKGWNTQCNIMADSCPSKMMRCAPNTQNSSCGYIPDGSGTEPTVGTYKKGKKCNKFAKIKKYVCCTCITLLGSTAVGTLAGYIVVLAI